MLTLADISSGNTGTADVLFLIAAIIFILGAFGVSPLGTSPQEWQDVGLAAFVLGALV